MYFIWQQNVRNIAMLFGNTYKHIFYRKTHTKNSYKIHINCNNNNKKDKKYDIPKEDNV